MKLIPTKRDRTPPLRKAAPDATKESKRFFQEGESQQVGGEYQGGSDGGRSQGGDECRCRQIRVPITGGTREFQGGSDGGRNEEEGDGRMKQV